MSLVWTGPEPDSRAEAYQRHLAVHVWTQNVRGCPWCKDERESEQMETERKNR